MLTKKQLLDFNKQLIALYETGTIHSPIHLSGGNEDALIKLFKHYHKGDWIFSTWRSHYHWLLSGRSPEALLKQISDGHSMHIFGDKFFTSAIVGGIAPIALGVAQALKYKNSKEKVWCFLGCMGASGGLAQECIRYAEGWDLPIFYIIEDNDMSVRACTTTVWGKQTKKKKVYHYSYKRTYPHAGTGKYVMF